MLCLYRLMCVCFTLYVMNIIMQDYKPDEDPSKFQSTKTGRGPLQPNWMVRTYLHTYTHTYIHTYRIYLY